MNVDYVKFRKKFDSRTISREIIFLRTKRENGKKLKGFALYPSLSFYQRNNKAIKVVDRH